VDEVNDLGVVIDSRFTFHTYIKRNIVRASVRANLIHKCFISREAFTLTLAFKVYVRPILEYVSCTWSPHHILKIQQVETVQRKLTKQLPGYASLCYKERLSNLDLDSMEMCQLRHNLLYYKLYLTWSVELQMICSRLQHFVFNSNSRPSVQPIPNYTCITVLLM